MRFTALVLTFLSFLNSIQAGGLTLDQAFQSALKHSAALGSRSAVQAQADARLTQAKAAFAPSLRGLAAYTAQDGAGILGRSASAFSARLNLTQDLTFWGGKVGLLKAASQLEEAAGLRLRAAQDSLYADLAQAYYGLAAEEADAVHLAEQVRLNETRVVEMVKRERQGRSRKAELLTARAQLAQARASAAAQEALRAAARERLATFTGQPVTEAPAWTPASAQWPEVEALSALAPRLESQPLLKALRLEAEAALSAARAARGHWLPSLDAQANYFLKRPSPLEDAKWDASLNLSWPFFSGFGDLARQREAGARARQAELDLEAARQLLEGDLRSLARQVGLKAAELAALAEAARDTEAAYKEQLRDYDSSLTTSLELTQSFQSYVETVRRLDRARSEDASTRAGLKALIGER